jgi:hypothetical protein
VLDFLLSKTELNGRRLRNQPCKDRNPRSLQHGRSGPLVLLKVAGTSKARPSPIKRTTLRVPSWTADPGAQLGLDTVIQIVRDFTPGLNATDLNSHAIQSVLAHQSRTFWYLRPILQPPSKPGARASRICNRARISLVFTLDLLVPSICAVSSVLNC